MEYENGQNIIGRVVQADIGKQYIRAHLKVDTENVFIGMPCIISGARADYYCIITNVIENRDDVTLNMSFSDIDIDDGISEVVANFEKPEAMESYIDLLCLKIIYHDTGTRIPFKTIPSRLSPVRRATQEDIHIAYIKPILDLYGRPPPEDPEVDIPKEFNPDGFTFGFLSSDPTIKVPVRFDKMIERPLAVVGMTGAGKTVTIKNILFRIIGDINGILKTRMIIFDVQNEYITLKQYRKDPGVYDLYPDRVEIITLDPRNCERMGIHTARRFEIFEDNIGLDDVISALSNTSLTEKMVRTLGHIYRSWLNNHGERETFYDLLVKFYNDERFAKQFDSEGTSYSALRSRLRLMIHGEGDLGDFITSRDDSASGMDTIEYILGQLRSDNPDKNSFIIHFGRYGKIPRIYEFIANLLGKRIYNVYSEENDIIDEDGDSVYDRCVILLEEAHKFIGEGSGGSRSIFNLIARETRKYGLTLFIVDQMPSKIDKEIMAQMNNRIIHRMIDANDINNSLAGLNVSQWRNIVATLDDGEALCFGTMVEHMPTIIKSFYGDPQKFKEFHGISQHITVLRNASEKNVLHTESNSESISIIEEILRDDEGATNEERRVKRRGIDPPDISDDGDDLDLDFGELF